MARQTPGNHPSVVFRAKKRRQIAILWLGLPFIGVIVWFEQFPQQLNNAVAGTLAIVAISYVAFAVIFSLLNSSIAANLQRVEPAVSCLSERARVAGCPSVLAPFRTHLSALRHG